MLTKKMEEVLKYYNLGLTSYKQRKWDEAIKSFDMALQIDPDDGPSQIYLQRAQEYKVVPPGEDWDGVFTMTTK